MVLNRSVRNHDQWLKGAWGPEMGVQKSQVLISPLPVGTSFWGEAGFPSPMGCVSPLCLRQCLPTPAERRSVCSGASCWVQLNGWSRHPSPRPREAAAPRHAVSAEPPETRWEPGLLWGSCRSSKHFFLPKRMEMLFEISELPPHSSMLTAI